MTTCSTGWRWASAPPLDKQPKLFWVNWFRKSDEGKFLWPGLRRQQPGPQVGPRAGRRHRRRRRHRHRPGPARPTALDTSGLDIDEGTLDQLLTVDNEAWRGEIPLIDEHFKFIGERLPSEMSDELRELEKRLAG